MSTSRPEREWHQPRRLRHSPLLRLLRLWETRDPVSFNDKVRYKLLRDRRELQVIYADKARMRELVTARVGDEYLPELLALVSDPQELAMLSLPAACVVKPTHGSGACIVVSERADPHTLLPHPAESWVYAHVRPEAIDPARLAEIGAHWCAQTYGGGPNHEWAYTRAQPRVMVEELLQTRSGDVPADYKLFVMNGRCRFVQLDEGRFGVHTRDFFTPTWDHLDLRGGLPNAPEIPVRPAALTEMIELAESLAHDTDFARVDLFVLPDRVVVGELTASPAAGNSGFDPPHWNRVFGDAWEVPRRY